MQQEILEGDDPKRSEIVEHIEQALDRVVRRLKMRSRRGGFLCVRSNSASVDPALPPDLIELLGAAVPSKFAQEFFDRSERNARRLAMCLEHVSSWESRDEQAGQFGGAIRAGDYVLSFAGLTEHGDEAVVAFAAYSLALIAVADVRNVVAKSGNNLLATMLLDVDTTEPAPASEP